MEKETPKTVNMAPPGNETKPKEEKLTYEQLEEAANRWRAECSMLYKRCQQAEGMLAQFNEVGMLLDILDKSTFFKDAFVDRCSSTIENIITRALDESEKAEQSAEQPEK